MKLSIVIVNYNVKYFLEQCLHSVFNACKNLSAEVFVVDNNSVDGSVKMLEQQFPQVNLIINKENVGFAKANNQAIALARGEYILLLNPDTLVEEDTFDKCIAFMESTADAGGLGVKMVNGKGEFLPESKRGLPIPSVAFYKIFGLSKLFPKSKKFGSYHLTYLDADKIHSVEVLSGAFMLIRKSVLDNIGFLDEDYFMYGEDIDLSYRITQSGYKNYYFPETRIIHYKGESTKKGSLNYVFVFYRAMQIFAQKHFSQKNAKIFNWFINFAIWFRAALSMLKRIGKSILLPLLDFILIYAGMIALSTYWENMVLQPKGSGFPNTFIFIVIPIYILVWLLAISFCKGYKSPIQLGNTNKGILLGTIGILLVYALLPESFRFSRAIIIFGAMWTVVALNSIRYILHKFHFKDIMIGEKPNQRIAIVGQHQEAKRVAALAQLGHQKIEFIGLVNVSEQVDDSDFTLGTLSQINDIISIFSIKEVIFCAKDLSSEQIISLMCDLQDTHVEFKIAPEGSSSIIGSNSISAVDDMYTFHLNPVMMKENRRKKRVLDVITSAFLLLFSFIAIWFIDEKRSFIRNIFNVFSGKKSWVGYAPEYTKHYAKHPFLKPGILYPTDIFKMKNSGSDLLDKINQMYIQEYDIMNDIRIILKGFRHLGRSTG